MRPVCVCLLNVYKIFTATEGTLTSLLLPTRPWHPDAHRLTSYTSHRHTHTHTHNHAHTSRHLAHKSSHTTLPAPPFHATLHISVSSGDDPSLAGGLAVVTE